MILEKAIKQDRFENERVRVAVNLYYTQSQLQYENNAQLKPYNISVQQYNILRIVKGQKDKPISISDIASRMIDKMSNTSRLVEKMRQKDLVKRIACPNDRRRADVYLTKEGLALLGQASEAIEKQTIEKFLSLTDKEIEVLNELLDKVNQ